MNFFKFSKFSKFLVCLSFSLLFSGFSTHGMDRPEPLTPETVEPENISIDNVAKMLKDKFKDRIIVCFPQDSNLKLENVKVDDIDFRYAAQEFNKSQGNNYVFDQAKFNKYNAEKKFLSIVFKQYNNAKITKYIYFYSEADEDSKNILRFLGYDI